MAEPQRAPAATLALRPQLCIWYHNNPNVNLPWQLTVILLRNQRLIFYSCGILTLLVNICPTSRLARGPTPRRIYTLITLSIAAVAHLHFHFHQLSSLTLFARRIYFDYLGYYVSPTWISDMKMPKNRITLLGDCDANFGIFLRKVCIEKKNDCEVFMLNSIELWH